MEYLVRVPVTQEVYITLDAESKKEAKQKAFEIMRGSMGEFPEGYRVKGWYYHVRQIDEIKQDEEIEE